MLNDWSRLAAELTASLHLTSPPLAISFGARPPDGVHAFDEPMAPPAPDGRTGRVSAGCVFWIKAAAQTLTTVAEDHANCSVGSYTHGFITLEEAATRSDVATLLDTGWVTMDMVPGIPAVSEAPGAVTYGPLADTPVDPDVVFLRVNAKQLMVLSDAVPDLVVEGKPQCHIIPMAKESNRVAASVGCALSRARTGMEATEMTCAIPAGRLPSVVDSIKRNAVADAAVSAYAALDARRFS